MFGRVEEAKVGEKMASRVRTVELKMAAVFPDALARALGSENPDSVRATEWPSILNGVGVGEQRRFEKIGPRQLSISSAAKHECCRQLPFELVHSIIRRWETATPQCVATPFCKVIVTERQGANINISPVWHDLTVAVQTLCDSMGYQGLSVANRECLVQYAILNRYGPGAAYVTYDEVVETIVESDRFRSLLGRI